MESSMFAGEPELRQLHEWWCDRAGPGHAQLPVLSHFEEIELLNSGHISLVEVRHDPLRFRYRLVSPELSAQLGYDVSGKLTEAIPEPAVRAHVEALYERAVRTRAPICDGGELLLDGRRWSHRTLVLPLSLEGAAVDTLLICRKAASSIT